MKGFFNTKNVQGINDWMVEMKEYKIFFERLRCSGHFQGHNSKTRSF